MDRTKRLPILPSRERIEAGFVRILSMTRTGKRALALLHDDTEGITFAALCFFDDEGTLTHIGQSFGLRYGDRGLDDLTAMIETARAAPRT